MLNGLCLAPASCLPYCLWPQGASGETPEKAHRLCGGSVGLTAGTTTIAGPEPTEHPAGGRVPGVTSGDHTAQGTAGRCHHQRASTADLASVPGPVLPRLRATANTGVEYP